MTRNAIPKQRSRSVKNTGGKDAKKKKKSKLKEGIFFTIIGDAKYYILDVNKRGKMERTEIEPQVIVDCMMYIIEQGVREMVKKAETEQQVTNQEKSATDTATRK